MKRKFLEDSGLEKEVIDKILDENSADIGRAKGELETVKNQLEAAQQAIAERDTQLEALQNSVGDNQELQEQISQLQAENQKKANELIKVRRDGIDEILLMEAGVKNSKAAKALLSAIEEADDEKYKSQRAEEIKALAEAEDTGFLFGKKQIAGAEPGEPGDGNPGGEPDMSKMTYEEITAYYESNPDA